jgi:sugar O-acyltransferase (sialic acid O-acetyltransferase NeuD family)
MQDLVIIGAGGFAREVLDVVDAMNAATPTFNVAGFRVESEYYEEGTVIHEVPIAGDLSWLEGRGDSVQVVVGIGDPAARRRIVARTDELGIRGAVLVHPQAVTTRWLQLGEGSIVTAGCVLTNEITLGRHVHVNLCCTIGHDTVIGDFATFAPGICVSGNVITGEGAFVGTGVNIMEKVFVGEWSRVGAGSVVIKDIPANTTAVGTPAKVVRERESGWHL